MTKISRPVLLGCLLVLASHFAARGQGCSPDVTPPGCVPPPSVTVTCDAFDPSLWQYLPATTSDNCCLDPNKVYQGQTGLVHTANYTLFDTLCNKGTIVRQFKAYDCAGNTSVCTQTIVVNYEQEYYLRFPNDMIVPISVANTNAFYGEPSFFNEDCELIGISYEDAFFPHLQDSTLWLERTWTIINWCTYDPMLPIIQIPNPQPNPSTYHSQNLVGVTVSALNAQAPWNPTVSKILPTDPGPTNFSIFYDADANGYRYTQHIFITDTLYGGVFGTVYSDSNYDCALNAGDIGLENWAVKGVGQVTGRVYWAYTDFNGEYSMGVSLLDTLVQITLESSLNYATNCPNTYLVHVPVAGTATQNLAVVLNGECPVMQVDLATNLLRRCFPNYYTVNVCNASQQTITNAYVEVELDEYMTYTLSTLPAQPLGNNKYSFQLGDLTPGQCKHFNVVANIECTAPLGATHCVTAHAYPDNLCGGAQGWSGADIRVSGYCDGDSVRMKITNVGTGNMTQPQGFVVVEDVVMYDAGSFQLNSTEEFSLAFDGNGATWHLEAQQEPGHPYGGPETVSVEGCGGLNQTGLVTMFPVNDPNPFIATDCRQNVGSWDPNDKSATPAGYGAEHFVKANTPLEYLIRFQNTGTDTAFTVVVMDTLSNALDAVQVKPGASSHPYSFELLDGHILRFRFDNIQLPDSNVNEAASHGFVKFWIPQQPNNPDGVVIENEAAIYFDYNDPVITNKVYHTIGEHFVTVDVDPGPLSEAVRWFPTPALTYVWLEVPVTPGLFELMDMQGRVVRREKIQESPWRFERGSLPAGAYLFRVETIEGKITGKIVLE